MEIVPIIVGFLFSGFGIVMLVDTYKFRETAEKTVGKILGYEHHQSTMNNSTTTLYTPVIEYYYQGEECRFKAEISTGNMPYIIGEAVTVLY